MPRQRLRRVVAAAVAALTAAAFLPALRAGFVNWDDPATLLLNGRWRGFDAASLRWMFGSLYMGNYQPLSWMSYALDYRLWGLDPRGYHLTNVALHALNAALFFLVAVRLLERSRGADGRAGERALVAGAAFAALLFSLHPLRVESVAWASERRDVLSAFFFLSCVLAYLKADDGGAARRRWLAASWGALSLSLLAKGSGVVLPAVLLLLDFYPLRRRAWLEKAFFALPALAAGAVGLFGQVGNGASMTLADWGWAPRLIQAGYALSFYLGKTLLPSRLSPLYLHPSPSPWAFVMLGPALLGLALTLAALALSRRLPAAAALWAYYLLVLVPVLGLIPFGMQVAADRYTYLSCLGWALAGGALLRAAFDRGWAPPAATAVLVALAALTWRQTGVWRDSESLWTQALFVDPADPVAHANLGSALAEAGRVQEAIPHFQAAVELSPGMAKAWNDLGAAYASLGRPEEAAECFRRALRISPSGSGAAENLRRLERRGM